MLKFKSHVGIIDRMRCLETVKKKILGLALTTLLCGCSAVSVLAPINEGEGDGIVRFYESGKRIKVEVYIANLEPLTKHNLRIFDVGDCRDPLGGSIGKPFDHTTHNLQRVNVNPEQYGDLGDIMADEDGVIESYFTIMGAKLSGSSRGSILGRSLILTIKAENNTPAEAIACGLISKNPTL
jgi:Cu/Zn superoxide dismutase